MSNVIPFRPRPQVARSLRTITTPKPRYSWEESLPIRLDGKVRFNLLMAAFIAAGLEAVLDERTHSMLIRPADQESAS